MTLPNFFFGFWKISNVVVEGRKRNSKDIIGTEFQLTSSGNVIWKTAKKIGSFPLLNFKIYVIHKSSCGPYHKLKFATGRGHIVECEIESVESSKVFVFSDGWCTYTCEKTSAYEEYLVGVQFNFLPALENNYFSDLVIKADNKKEFHVHKCILKCAAPELDWLVDPPPLFGYPEEVLGTILHYLYGGCLPKGLSKRTLKDVILLATELPGMENLISLCVFQSDNLSLKTEIFDLVSDIGVCISKMRDIFTQPEQKFKIFSGEFDELYSAAKKSFQEGALAIAKFLVLCKTYVNARTKLSQEDDFEILQHILSKIPIYTTHLKEYTQNLIGTIRRIHAIPDCWEHFISFLLPKVQEILDIVSSILLKIGDCSGAMAAAFQEHFNDFYINKCFDTVTYPMGSDFDKPPLNTVIFFAKEFKGIILHFEKERRRFNRIDLESKVRLVSLTLEEFLAEVANCKGAFKEFIEFLEKQVIKGKIYFGMKIIAMKTNDVLNKIVGRRSSLVNLLLQFCDLVERDAFFECVVSLGFLDLTQNTLDSKKKDEENYVFPAIESACKSPPVHLSHVSKVGLQLLESRDLNDMVFEVIYSKGLDISVNLTQNDSDESDSDESDSEADAKDQSAPESFIMKAHRAIVSSRCDWFRLALFSGMKEDINRKIEIHLTPSLFSLFLEFLYTGCLARSEITYNDFLRLLLLSDRYDFEHLKEVCEFSLKNYIDEQTVFYLFNVADRYNANKLKFYCEEFITEYPVVVSSDRFRELPDNLKREAIICSKGHTTKNSYLINILCNDSFDTLEESLNMLKKRLNCMGVQATDYEITIAALRPKLEKAVLQLKERIGSEVPRKVLVRAILDADYDVNRAAILYTLRSQIL